MKQSVEIVQGSPNNPLTGLEPATFKPVEPQHYYKFKDPSYSKGNDTYPILGSMANFISQKLINGDKYFVHPFYDLQKSIITASRDPVVEVAGPTTSGYAVLDGLALFSHPIVTNIGSSEKYSEPGKFEELTENDKTLIDVIASASHLPFPDCSLGILLASCLPKIDLRLLHDGRANGAHMDQMLKLVAERSSSGLDIEPWRDISPRVGFWLEAARTVRKGGIIIYKGASPEDLDIAKAQGFSVIAHSSVGFTQYYKERVSFENNPGEIVLINDSSYDKYPVEPTVSQIVQGAMRGYLKQKFPRGIKV